MRTRLLVENPQDPLIDVGKSSFNIKKVQRAFQHAYDTLIFNNTANKSLLKLIITCDTDRLKNVEGNLTIEKPDKEKVPADNDGGLTIEKQQQPELTIEKCEYEDLFWIYKFKVLYENILSSFPWK